LVNAVPPRPASSAILRKMARSLQEQLDAVDALIAEYESEPMEEYSQAERRYRRARLAELYAERGRLQDRIDGQTGGKFRLATFVSRRG
jgi:hypothetical protein